MAIQIKFADQCAWRAIYVYRNHPRYGQTLTFSLGIDPTFYGNRARLFGAIGFRTSCVGARNAAWQWSLPLWYSRHWWRLDGRYGTLRRTKS